MYKTAEIKKDIEDLEKIVRYSELSENLKATLKVSLIRLKIEHNKYLNKRNIKNE